MSTKIKFELLPNEIFIECFQYLTTMDVFYSFDQLNYRFNKLIRNIPLYFDFQQMKKLRFKQFCKIILSNPEMKYKIISLKLSNIDTLGQIHEFLSLFRLNEFINLQSLSLIKLTNNNIEQLLPMLPFLMNLSNCSFIDLKYRISEILSSLSKSKLRILSISELNYDISIFKQLSITSLTISHCDLFYLCKLFKHISILKYLKIGELDDDTFFNDSLQFHTVYLKQLIIDNYMATFERFELLLKSTPNLTIFTINASDSINMVYANRWQYLIESSLLHLRVFNFYFSFIYRHSYNDMLKKLQQFQTDFWCKQHNWYTNYEISNHVASIYTIPYIWNEYSIVSMMKRFRNSNEFDNVTKLFLSKKAIKNDSLYYFKNVKSLTLMNEFDNDGNLNKNKLKLKQIKFLHNIVNLSNIKQLTIANTYNMVSSPILLKILKDLPYVSLLRIDKNILLSFFMNYELCEYLNRKISILDINSYSHDCSITSFQIKLIYKMFSNLEQLHCYIGKLDDLLLVLKQCSKLSIVNIRCITKRIYSWYQVNASKLNVYIDFNSFDRTRCDLWGF